MASVLDRYLELLIRQYLNQIQADKLFQLSLPLGHYQFNNYRTVSSDVPEETIAFDEGWLRELYRKQGLKIVRLDYGSWCARENYLSYQDLVLAVKEQS